MQTDEVLEVLNRPVSRELPARDLTRLAYDDAAEPGRGTAPPAGRAPGRLK